MRRKLSNDTINSDDLSSPEGVVPHYKLPESSSPIGKAKKIVYHNPKEEEEDDTLSYCSIDGEHYQDMGFLLGSGKNGQAWTFISDDGKEIVVVKPKAGDDRVNAVDREEAYRKFIYFATLYPRLLTCIHWVNPDTEDPSYRIVLPKFSGKTLRAYINQANLSFDDRLRAIIATAYQLNQAVKLHRLITIDLHSANVIFDEQFSWVLIDGGDSVFLDLPIHDKYSRETHEEIEDAIEETIQIAPECWYLEGEEPPLATEAMDVFAFGILMREVPTPSDSLKKLIELCLNYDPKLRPSFELIIQLLELIAQKEHLILDAIFNYFAEHKLLRMLTNQEINTLIKLKEIGLIDCCSYVLKSRRLVKNLLQYDTPSMIKAVIALYQFGREDLYRHLKTNYNFAFELSLNWNNDLAVSKIITSYGYKSKQYFFREKKASKEETPCNLYFFVQYDKNNAINKKVIQERWDIEPPEEESNNRRLQ